MKTSTKVFAASLTVALCMGCGASRKVQNLSTQNIAASLQLSSEKEEMLPDIDLNTLGNVRSDTIKVTDINGNEVFLMKAVQSEDGEMVAHEVLDAAVVTARFRNVAERHGKIDIQFDIIVPEDMMDKDWQLRFTPDMYVLEDSTRLESVIVTGSEYRHRQLKGMEQYERWLSKIVSDTTRFINVGQLEIWLSRWLPQLYAFKSDSSLVSDEAFANVYGVSEQQAVEHYTNTHAISRNEHRKASMSKMYAKYVKVPIASEGIRLDTVMRDINGDFVYAYTQTVETRPKLRKIDIVLSGDVWEQDNMIYRMSRSEPLTFYVSSLSAFVDPANRYLTRTIYRQAEANTACYIAFEVGRADVKEDYLDNASEMSRIKGNLGDVLSNATYDLDSIVVSASASPEGSYASNRALSQRRSESVARYFEKYMKSYQDSLDAERGFAVDLDGNIVHEGRVDVKFIGHATPENWDGLDALVRLDTVMTEAQKEEYFSFADTMDPDQREARLQKTAFYRYMRESLYPRVRTVRFDFYLHRKGMIEESVQTTEIDTTYMMGVQAIRDRDYQEALKYLAPYNDYNTAVAYCALERNLSAIAILESLERTAEVNYMLAVCYSREGRIRDALQCYTQSCQQNATYVSRGNLDPEISALIKAYGLNREEEDEFEYSF